MNRTFSKFLYEVLDYLDDYMFIGRITVNSSLIYGTIDGTIVLNLKELDNILVRVNFDNDIISVSTSNLDVLNTPKEIISQFIDRLITEVNRLYTAYITALNS